MKTRAYNIAYLDDAMSSIGAMLDYAVNACGEDIVIFYSRFIASGIAGACATANPKYLSGMSGIELAMLVASRTGDALPEKEAYIDMGSPEYWTGWTLAYLSWYLNTDYKTLQSRGVGVQDIYDRYQVLHEADLSKTVQFATKRLEERSENPFKQARKNASLTQRMLADMSGNSLRVIRSYEQGQRSVANAGAESVLRLCRALNCPITALL
jgi:Helix-turn-helix.